MRKVLVTTTLIVVLFTTIVLGGGTLPLVKYLVCMNWFYKFSNAYLSGKSKWSKEQKKAQEKGHHIVQNQGVWRLGQ